MSETHDKLSEDELSEKIEEFRKWIETEPDLPKNIGRISLKFNKTNIFYDILKIFSFNSEFFCNFYKTSRQSSSDEIFENIWI